MSPNVGRKTESFPFWQKIVTHGILEVLMSNSDLDFWNSKFGQIWAEKVKTVCFVWELAHMQSISKMLVHILVSVFSYFKSKSWGCWFWPHIHLIFCSYIFIVTKCKNGSNQQKNAWLMGWFLIKKILFQPNFETRSRLLLNLYIVGRPFSI